MYLSDLEHPDKDLEEKLYQLYKLNREKTIDLSFRPPYLDLLTAFGNPHLQLPPVIHVAGTNGKGSTIAFLKAILEAAGLRVHTYTSPHLIYFNERIVLAGKAISNAYLNELIDEALTLNNGNAVTFFEITTAIAFAAFSRVPADIVLLETGLGGRLDCTNVVENPLVSIITPIGYDHTEFLGGALDKIAWEKAGIIKERCPVVVSPQLNGIEGDKISSVIEAVAEEKKSSVYMYGKAWQVVNDDQDSFKLTWNGESDVFPKPSLKGNHQIFNASQAIMALKVIQAQLPRAIESKHIKAGLSEAKWPGRLQKLDKYSSDHLEVWLDGGHNAHASAMLAEKMKEWEENDPKPLTLILGMMGHKDILGFIKPLLPFLGKIICVPIDNEPKAMTVDSLAQAVAEVSGVIPIEIEGNYKMALDKNMNTKTDRRVLICGSLYLTGLVLQSQ